MIIMEKKLQVAALKNGTVIDHIPSEKLFQVFTILHLQHCENTITFGNNLESKTMGSKGIIKIADKFFADEEVNKISLIVPNAKINIIKNYEVVEKRPLQLPKSIEVTAVCPNPACITNHQPILTKHIILSEENQIKLKCHYCEKEAKLEEVKIK